MVLYINLECSRYNKLTFYDAYFTYTLMTSLEFFESNVYWISLEMLRGDVGKLFL